MGPTAYALCQKPLVGALMYISSLCGFPPLVQNAPLSLESAGSSASVPFAVKVDKTYPVNLDFVFPSADAYQRDEVVGSRFDSNCRPGVKYDDIPAAQRVGLGRPIPFRVRVRRKSDQVVVIEQTFNSLCQVSSAAHLASKSRQIGPLALTRGQYILEVTNLQAQAGLEGVKTAFSLVAGHGK